MKKESSYLKDDYILNMSKFLYIYYNIEGKGLFKLSHSQVKDMLDIKSLANDSINTNDVMLGKTLLVRDSEDIVLGYANPLVNIDIEEEERTSRLLIDFDQKINHIRIENLDDYSDYELEELINLCKKNKDEKMKCTIIKELHKRKGSLNKRKADKIEKIKKLELRKEW